MIYDKQVMSADCIIAMSHLLCRFEPLSHLPKQDIPTADSSRHACLEPRRATAIVYRHILLGENSFHLIPTRAHEKIRLDFFRAEQLYVLYIAGKNVKNVRSHMREDFLHRFIASFG